MLYLLLSFLGVVHGASVWVSPTPRLDSESRLVDYPCGNGEYNTNWEGDFTTLKVGVNTVEWSERLVMPGAPYRIAFSYFGHDRFNDFVLLDQIPHNKLRDGEPITGDRFHQVDITIPDVDCSEQNCALQLVQIGVNCSSSDLAISCGAPNDVLFNCANIRVNGTVAAIDLHPIYTSFDGASEPQSWVVPTEMEWPENNGIYSLTGGDTVIPAEPEHWFFTYLIYISAGGGALLVCVCGCCCYRKHKAKQVLLNADDFGGNTAYQPMANQDIDYSDY